jgi:hypothetical protein
MHKYVITNQWYVDISWDTIGYLTSKIIGSSSDLRPVYGYKLVRKMLSKPLD